MTLAERLQLPDVAGLPDWAAAAALNAPHADNGEMWIDVPTHAVRGALLTTGELDLTAATVSMLASSKVALASTGNRFATGALLVSLSAGVNLEAAAPTIALAAGDTLSLSGATSVLAQAGSGAAVAGLVAVLGLAVVARTAALT